MQAAAVAAGPLSGLTTSDIIKIILSVEYVIIITLLVWSGRQLISKIDRLTDETCTKIDGLIQKIDTAIDGFNARSKG